MEGNRNRIDDLSGRVLLAIGVGISVGLAAGAGIALALVFALRDIRSTR